MLQKMRMYKEKGFTLQEMLIVIAIILILFSIGVPITGNVMKNSDTEEFVSNAKLVEEAGHAYYRDSGKYPVGDITYTHTATASAVPKNNTTTVFASSDAKISAESRLIILSKLVEHGVTNAKEVYDKLLADGKFRSVKMKDLTKYSRVDLDSNGAEDFIIVDLVDKVTLEASYGIYENDIAGFIFSADTRSKTTGVVYSGAYELSKKKLEKVEENADILDKGKHDEIKDEKLYPYGFKIQTVEPTTSAIGNKQANVTLVWTRKFTDSEGDLEHFKGYVGKHYTLEVYPKDTDFESNPTPLHTESVTSLKTTIPLNFGEYYFILQATDIEYASKIVSGKKSEKIGLNRVPGTDHEDDLAPGAPADLNDILIGGPDTGDGEDKVIDVCAPIEDCNLGEIIEGTPNDEKEKLYEFLVESDSSNKENFSSSKKGLHIKDVKVKDLIVLREVKKSGSTFTVYPDRTFVFQAYGTNVLIPKSPYLQKDFQINAGSKYMYIIEIYRNKLLDSSGKTTHPKNAVEVYYKY